MLDTIDPSCSLATETSSWDDVLMVCRLIPPLWDLRNYVAVNPFMNFMTRPMDSAARTIADGLDASVLPDVDFYRSRWKSGEFDATDLRKAAQRMACDSEQLQAILDGRIPAPVRDTCPVLTFAERLDRQRGGHWNDMVIRSAARWCAVYAAEGGKYWGLPVEGNLFGWWREMAATDRSLDVMGLRGFRRWISELPDQPGDAITEMLDRLGDLVIDREAYLYRLLGGLYGWASYFRRIAWEKDVNDRGLVIDLLAIRICMDVAVHVLVPLRAATDGIVVSSAVEDESTRLVLQEALEDGYTRRLLEEVLPPTPTPNATKRPELQAVFCIDVRSEPFRRHLEAESAGIETRGFAGFFGVALNWRCDGEESARCPVLLKPGVTVERLDTEGNEGRSAGSLLSTLQYAPAASFSFVEILGTAYGVRLTKDSLDPGDTEGHAEGESIDGFKLASDGRAGGIDLAGRVNLAAGILKNMGLRDRFARLVLLCGHESHSANNPHAAGLDCGACGGHGGAINARVAAALLNDRGVRDGLAGRGWKIPSDTRFLPGVHDTSTDEVRLLDLDRVSLEHQADYEQLATWLKNAGFKTRQERASKLGLVEKPSTLLDRILRRRSRDGSEVRPEWGLARNAAFIAARRSRTRGVDLDGRAFLHEYDSEADSDDSVLSLILSAPMVVASWINLQYFASTVDNDVFGAGDKTLHNRIGTIGVVLGNGGDLRTGLPLQSVQSADGSWFHEPLRLQVIVEADTDKIDRVVAAHPMVRDLLENGWVRLFALDRESMETTRYVPGLGWAGF